MSQFRNPWIFYRAATASYHDNIIDLWMTMVTTKRNVPTYSYSNSLITQGGRPPWLYTSRLGITCWHLQRKGWGMKKEPNAVKCKLLRPNSPNLEVPCISQAQGSYRTESFSEWCWSTVWRVWLPLKCAAGRCYLVEHNSCIAIYHWFSITQSSACMVGVSL